METKIQNMDATGLRYELSQAFMCLPAPPSSSVIVVCDADSSVSFERRARYGGQA